MQVFYKYSLIFLVFVFGALMFIAGNLLPDNFYAQIEPSVKSLLANGIAPGKLLNGANTTDSKKSNATKPVAATSATKTQVGTASSKQDASKVVDYESLLRAQSLPDDTVYSLQIGLYQQQANAAETQALLAQYGFSGQFVEVEDTQKMRWFLFFQGKFKTLTSAEVAAYELLSLTGVRAQVIQFPEPPKK